MESKRKPGRPPKRKLISDINKTTASEICENPVKFRSDFNARDRLSNHDVSPSIPIGDKTDNKFPKYPSALKRPHIKKASMSQFEETEQILGKGKLTEQSIQNRQESFATLEELTWEEYQQSFEIESKKYTKKPKVTRKFLPFEDNENSLVEFLSVQNGINNKEPEEITAEMILNKSIFTMNKCPMKPGNLPRPTSSGDDKWIPPRSPYFLIQEQLFHDPWKMLVATILLEQNKGQKIIPTVWKLLNHWPTAERLQYAKVDDVAKCLLLGGLNHTIAQTIIRFSNEFLMKTWTYPIELHGIGNYGNDSYRIFCINEWKQ
ncbi:unnamed protein product, partial [Lymnaea stagnalis]